MKIIKIIYIILTLIGGYYAPVMSDTLSILLMLNVVICAWWLIITKVKEEAK